MIPFGLLELSSFKTGFILLKLLLIVLLKSFWVDHNKRATKEIYFGVTIPTTIA